MLSTVPKWRPLRWNLSFGKRKKSRGLRSGEYGGCGTTEISFLTKNSFTEMAVWQRALSWWSIQVSAISGRTRWTCMYIVTNTTIFFVVCLLLLRHNYMFRPSMLAIFRLWRYTYIPFSLSLLFDNRTGMTHLKTIPLISHFCTNWEVSGNEHNTVVRYRLWEREKTNFKTPLKLFFLLQRRLC